MLPEFWAIYIRVYGSLLLIPYNLNASGLIGRAILSLIFSQYFLNCNTTLPIASLGFFYNFIIGITISFSLLASFWSLLIYFEISENLRGMNYAIFFGADEFASSQQLAQGIKLILLIVFLEQNLLLEIFKQLDNSFSNFVSVENLAQQIADVSLASLSIGFHLLVPIVICFLIIQVFFMFVSKLYPQSSFFTEIFFTIMIVLLIITSGMI